MSHRRPVPSSWLLSLAAALLITAPGIVAAQPGTSIPAVQETVVVTASVSPETLGTVGRSLTLITRADLARLPISALTDIFRLVPSVEVRARGPRGVQADFAIRGAGFNQALVLVNGVRLNDAQSGHHNADIPVSLLDVERVELLLGGGASVHGADAFGGAVNVITRRAGPRFTADLSIGQHQLVEAAAAASLSAQPGTHVVSGEFNRSTGFAPDRDHDVRLARYQGQAGTRTGLSLAVVDKEFGAAGFYGPAPSREWTDQTLATVEHRLIARDRTQLTVEGAYRTHGDRFVYDRTRPALSDNRHRTHAISAQARWRRTIGPSTSLSGGLVGGRDVIDSTALGERRFARGGVFAELRQAVGTRLVVQPGLRVDRYSRFGTSWSPALAVSGWMTPRLRWRAAGGRTFRVPTFTELYYRDPNHQASALLAPERAWSADAGLEAYAAGWTASATVFGRWDADVIDWVRASPADRWQTTNIRDVETQGVELGLVRQAGARGQWGIRYTWIDAQAPTLTQQSKYVLDYAPHALALTGSYGWGGLSLGSRAGWTRRADGREYAIVDVRVARPIGRAEIYVDGANLLDRSYQEVRGVDMPGRWVRVGLRLR